MNSTKTIVITGSQTGMGLSTKQLLEKNGSKVIGVSNSGDPEITADLSTKEGVDYAVSEIIRLSNGQIDGIFANAGVDSENVELVFDLNYFGITRMLESLQPYLKKSNNSRVVINASNSVVITPGIPEEVVDALLNFEKEKAIQLIKSNPHYVYQVSKTAIAKWARQNAHKAEWAGNNISMNIIAPGVVLTPLIEHDMKDPRKAAGINMLPKPIGEIAKPDNIAPLVKFLLLDDSRFIIGQYIIIDGGTEVLWREKDSPKTWDISFDDFQKL
ncbi:SDR family oxidoreductase [Flavobacterium sp. M31R6]|uniref:SDR family oxidoreductase n=1 Tax=Flavobacterium sp. M31R6 TaxID=2739062 RepID=UPI0015699684|nr:SDR family oxidoreductase [Flavobacterium sp. M31R6]QKJ64147.1 SDR family oxidoreductase [Flavobacterium sp. M31R6]